MAVIQGFDELVNALDETRLCLFDRRKLVVKALRAGGKVIEDRWKQDIPIRTGQALKAVETSADNETAVSANVRVGVKDAGFYLKFDELGTAHQPARPKLGPAFDEKEEEAFETIAEIIGDGIEKAFYE